MLNLAKLTENEILPVSQVIYFNEEANVNENNYKLLELDKHLLECLGEGQLLNIVGDDDENAVLCTDTKTYEILEAETSNSILLAENVKFHDTLKSDKERSLSKIKISSIFYDYLEIFLTKPRLKKLKGILEETVYKGPEHEYSVDKEKLKTFEDLLKTVQASKVELKDCLSLMHTAEINGYVRLLEFEYVFRILSLMLKLIDENSWSLDEINYDITIESLTDLAPTEIIYSIFNYFTEKSKTINNQQLYRYKEDEVCKFFAQVLLQTGGKFNLNEFLQTWFESVPEGMNPNQEILYGIAIIDNKSSPKTIKSFLESDLPENINDRFKILFEVKEKWTAAEITPYIQYVLVF